MTTEQLLLLFFGLPLSILGMGLRRALGARGYLLMLLGATAAAAYDLVLEDALRRYGHGLPIPDPFGRGMLRAFGLFVLGGALLGALGGVLVRYRGRGLTPSQPEEGGDP